MWPMEDRHFGGETFANSEVRGFPRDLLRWTDETGCYAGHGLFAGGFGRFLVKVDAASEVEALLDGCANACRNTNHWHASSMSTPHIARTFVAPKPVSS
jgi:hypothetical protein